MNYNAPPTVGRFLGSDAFNRLIVGPVGSGKSSGCCVEGVRRSMETPPGPDGVRRSRGAIVRNTYPQLRDTTIKTWLQWVPEGEFGLWRPSDHTFEMKFETDAGERVEAEIMFRALDRPDDVKNLLSLELTWLYFNEMKEIPKSIFDMAQKRVGRYPRKEDVSRYWTGIFGDTNPMDTDHYLYRLFEEEKPTGYAVFKQPGGLAPNAENVKNLDRCFDVEAHVHRESGCEQARQASGNPSLHIGACAEGRAEQDRRLALGEHEEPCRCYYIKNFQGNDPDYVKVYRDGEYGFVKEGKAIYPEFQDSIHVAREPIPLLPGCLRLVIGNDFGLTPSAIWMQQDPSDGQWQVIKEFVSERMGAIAFGKEQLRICKTEFRSVKVFDGWGDPAGLASSQTDEDTPINCVVAAGVPMTAAPTNDYTLRREAVAGLLTRLTMNGRPALLISPTCTVLRKGMGGGYCFRRLQVIGDERFEDKPLKNRFSHVCEALQYAAVGEGEDHKALESSGGQGRKVSVNVRVHRSIGGSVPARGGHDSEEEGRPIHVHPSVRRR